MILMKKNVFQKIQLFKKIRNSIIFKFILKREFFKKGKLENRLIKLYNNYKQKI